jgi:hypothetical protein
MQKKTKQECALEPTLWLNVTMATFNFPSNLSQMAAFNLPSKLS